MIKYQKVDFSKFELNLKLLRSELTKYHNDIIVCYLFGSSQKREFKPLSDIDIAVLFKSKANRKKLEPQLLIEMMKIMKTQEIDLLILNETPLRIQYEILREKEILYCSDNLRRVDYETKVIKEYLDFYHILEEHKQQFLKSIGFRG